MRKEPVAAEILAAGWRFDAAGHAGGIYGWGGCFQSKSRADPHQTLALAPEDCPGTRTC